MAQCSQRSQYWVQVQEHILRSKLFSDYHALTDHKAWLGWFRKPLELNLSVSRRVDKFVHGSGWGKIVVTENWVVKCGLYWTDIGTPRYICIFRLQRLRIFILIFQKFLIWWYLMDNFKRSLHFRRILLNRNLTPIPPSVSARHPPVHPVHWAIQGHLPTWRTVRQNTGLLHQPGLQWLRYQVSWSPAVGEGGSGESPQGRALRGEPSGESPQGRALRYLIKKVSSRNPKKINQFKNNFVTIPF